MITTEYVTSDGTRFQELTEAKAYETQEKLLIHIDANIQTFYDPDVGFSVIEIEYVRDYILKHFSEIQKIVT